MSQRNIDDRVVHDFGNEWEAYEPLAVDAREHQALFDSYFSIFPFSALSDDAHGFDLGCGSGRWAEIMAGRVGHLTCVDPASKALDVARRRLAGKTNVTLVRASADDIPLADGSQDFGYSLGVLHHVPDTAAAMRTCVCKLKPGAPFLVYLYYRFDNRPYWFQIVWRVSDLVRGCVSKMPFALKRSVTTAIAGVVYWPLARLARAAERAGLAYRNIPLSAYRERSFQTMRNDALDRFGTRLEHRFTKLEVDALMRASGLTDIRFHDGEPYWTAIRYRSADGSAGPKPTAQASRL